MPEPIDLDAIEARERAATAGPWYPGAVEDAAICTGSPGGPVLYRGRPDFTPADAAFLAHARMDVPVLLRIARAARQVADLDRAPQPGLASWHLARQRAHEVLCAALGLPDA